MKLSKYISQIRGVSYKKSDLSPVLTEGYVPVIRANNIQNGKLNFDNLVYVKKERIKEIQIIKEGDVIIAASSGSKSIVGKAGQATEDLEMSFGAFCKLVRANEEINSEYLGHFFNSKKYRHTVSALAEGANINNLKNEHIDNLEILVPPIETQKQIVRVLDEAQSLIDNRKKQIEMLDDLIESEFYEMFGDPVKNEKGWNRGIIKDLTYKTQYGTSKKAGGSGAFPILRMGNITYRGNWDFTSLKYINLDEIEQKKYLVYKGDILFNRTNSKDLVGKTAVYREDIPMAYAGYLIKIIPNEFANAEYISEYLNCRHGKLCLKNMAKNIVGMANINAKEVQKIKILLPPLTLQNEFADKVHEIETQKEKLCESLRLMEDNYNSLMQKAFKGELYDSNKKVG